MNNEAIVWSKSSKSWGSAMRIQRNAYALRVMLAMTGGEWKCPSCGTDWDGTFEVDRVVPALDYRPGNIVYVCRANCNGPRGVLQSKGQDWNNVSLYAALVSAASETVAVPSKTEARREWTDRPAPVQRVSRFA